MFQTKVVKELKTRILCSVTLFFFENRAVYEIKCKNVRCMPQMTKWQIRTKCRIPKSTHTHTHTHTFTICNTECFSTATMVARMRLSVKFIRSLPVLLFYIN